MKLAPNCHHQSVPWQGWPHQEHRREMPWKRVQQGHQPTCAAAACRRDSPTFFPSRGCPGSQGSQDRELTKSSSTPLKLVNCGMAKSSLTLLGLANCVNACVNVPFLHYHFPCITCSPIYMYWPETSFLS